MNDPFSLFTMRQPDGALAAPSALSPMEFTLKQCSFSLKVSKLRIKLIKLTQ